MTAPTPEQMRNEAAWMNDVLAPAVGEPGSLMRRDVERFAATHRAAADLIERPEVPSCGFDTEQYATAYNAGFDAAVAQNLLDRPLAWLDRRHREESETQQ